MNSPGGLLPPLKPIPIKDRLSVIFIERGEIDVLDGAFCSRRNADPAVASYPKVSGLAGQGGYGIQSAPGASELAASLVLAQELPEALARQGVDVEALSPQRFG